MILPVVQAVLLLVAGAALFLLWRAAKPAERWLQWVVAAGFLARAFLGQALFWISWARLPIARSLQMGDGLWFFGIDAMMYIPEALGGLNRGLWGIITLERTAPSVMYVQVLALALWLFGRVTSVALVINGAAYLGMMILLVRWRAREPRAQAAASLAIASIALSPAFILWFTQPLKDTFFQFLFIAFVAACAAWQRAWVTRSATAGTKIVAGTLLVVLLFALSGIRWYFAFALLIATTLFLFLILVRTPERKLVAAGASLAVVFLLSRAVVLGAGPYLPKQIGAALSPMQAPTAVAHLPAELLGDADSVREGFSRAGGQTLIQPGRASGETSPIAASSSSGAAARLPLSPADQATVTQARAALHEQGHAWNRHDLGQVMAFYWKSPSLEVTNGATVIRGWDQLAAEMRKGDLGTLIVSDVRVDPIAGGAAVLHGRWQATTIDELRREGIFTIVMRPFPDQGWKIVRAASPPMPVPPAKNALQRRLGRRAVRFVSGTAAILLPRTLGERLGLYHIGGGRGMFWFAEADTLVFDVVLVVALAALAMRFRVALRNPMMWLVLLGTLLVAGPLVYSITNFGTLFRLRGMIYDGLLLLPLAAAIDASRGSASPAAASPPEDRPPSS